MTVNSQSMELKLENKEDQNRSTISSGHSRCSCLITSSIVWQGKNNHSSTSDGTTVLSLTPGVSQADLGSQFSGLPVNSQAVSRTCNGQHLTSYNGRSLISPASTIVIDSDALLQGWGAICEGKSTRGPWSHQEQTLHINYLELLAATLAIQTFAKGQSSISVPLRNSITAVATKLSHLAKTLWWLWCMEKNISLEAQSHELQESQSLAGQVRVETLTQSIPENQFSVRSPVNGPVCKLALHSAPNICQLEARPSGKGNRRIHTGLSRSSKEDLCKPSLEPDR